jgi:dephospho-CoA kinase
MIKIGLTGSIAMGKSEVARIFQEQGIPVFDADRAVHALYDSKLGVELLQPLVPDAIIENKIHRPTLSALVMKDADLLNQLEALVHAEVAKQRDAFHAQAKENGHAMVAYDIPLLFEKQIDKTVDITVVVSAPPHLQRERALARPGMTEERLNMILARQMPDAEKRLRAHYVIENNGTLSDLKNRSFEVLADIGKQHRL